MALAYSIRPFNSPVDKRPAAHLPCRTCGDVGKLPISGIGNIPDKIQKMFIRMEWDCDVHHPAKNMCPKCVRQRRIRANEPDEPQPAGRVFRPEPLIPVFDVPLVAGTRTGKEKMVSDIKKLDNNQKAALRREIEAHFDDSTGRYLEGHSDHTISEQLQIARVIVAEFRENFYGEIKVDPEVASLRDLIEQARKQMAGLQSTLEKVDTRQRNIEKKAGI